MTGEPADSYSLPFLPLSYIIACCVNNTRNFVAGKPGILNSGKYPFFRNGISVAYTASLSLYPNLT
jgi:hypothetical protein